MFGFIMFFEGKVIVVFGWKILKINILILKQLYV